MKEVSHSRFLECPSLESESWQTCFADHAARYLYAAGFVRGLRVLDAGTGPGYGAMILKQTGASSVHAVDIDEGAIAQARGRYHLEGLEFLVDDCQTLGQVRGPFDVICSFENIEHLQHPELFLNSAARLLAKDGVLFCSTPDRDCPNCEWSDGKPRNPYHVHEWFYDEFKELLSTCFGSVEILAQVESWSRVQRQKASESLNRHLRYLWSNPVLKLFRAAGKAVGRPQIWPEIWGFAAGSHEDFPVLSRYLLGVLGQPFCHFAVCREPKR